jgi:formamidopyrimidine-DNA glycosylase
MPELPEVERARSAIEQAGLNRRIADVDDTDTWVCRPHAPGEIAAALRGRTISSARRQGKSMWCETSGLGRSRTPGPVLGIHLGMSGRIVITRPGGTLPRAVTGSRARTPTRSTTPGAGRSGTGSPSPSPTADPWPCSTNAGSDGSGSTRI